MENPAVEAIRSQPVPYYLAIIGTVLLVNHVVEAGSEYSVIAMLVGLFAILLPWLNAHVEEARAEMGDDYWPYGLEKNQTALDTFLRYSFEQGLSKRKLNPVDLFAPETLDAFKI